MLNINLSYFGTVVECKNNDFSQKTSNANDLVIKSGCVEIKDSQGRIHLVPCLYNKKNIEFAFRNEACWQGGAWLGNTQLLPKMFYVDNTGRRITEDCIEVEFKKNTVHFPILAMLNNENNTPPDGGTKQEGYLKAYSAIWKFDPDSLVFDKEAVILYALTKGYLDSVEFSELANFEQNLYKEMNSDPKGIAISNHIKTTKQLPSDLDLEEFIKDCKRKYL